MDKKVLIVDDDEELVDFLEDYLEKEPVLLDNLISATRGTEFSLSKKSVI